VSLPQKASKLLAAVRHRRFRKALRYGVAPAIEHNALLRSLPPLGSIVDVGANGGQFSLVARRLHPSAQIIAFEPLPAAVRRYSRVFEGDQRVVLHRVAVGKTSEEADFHVSASDDSSSLLPITALQESTFPGTEQRGVERVSVLPLNEVLDSSQLTPPALLKIDVQGTELNVLLGVGELLGLLDYVLVEASFVELYSGQALAHEVIAHLAERGFVLGGIYNPTTDAEGRSVQADFFFTRRPGLVEDDVHGVT
jgi:FkbM family methyltransferase